MTPRQYRITNAFLLGFAAASFGVGLYLAMSA